MADDSTNACKEEDHKNEQTQSNQSLRTLLGGMKHGSNMASHSVCSQHNLDMPVVIFILAFIEVIRHIHTAQGTVGRVRNIGIAHLNALVATIVVATMGFIGEGIISTRTRIERADGFCVMQVNKQLVSKQCKGKAMGISYSSEVNLATSSNRCKFSFCYFTPTIVYRSCICIYR